MTKADLIAKLSNDVEISKAQAGRSLDALIESISGCLSKGDKISILGFGTWKVVKRKARKGRNPKTGKALKIAASKAPVFRPSAKLKGLLNSKKK